MKDAQNPILQRLRGGDRRTIGQSPAIVAEVLAKPKLFGVVFAGMQHDDPLIRMRCADAIEKISAHKPEWLRPYKRQLLEQIALIAQPEVRWHVAQMFSRLTWTQAQRRKLVAILNEYLCDESKIVKTFAMQALTDIALQDDALRPMIVQQLSELTRTGSPAMRSRGQKLLKLLRTCEQPKGDDR